MNYPKVFGTTDARKFLQVSEAYFLRLVHAGKIYFQKTSSGRIFFEADLVRLRDERVAKAKKDKRVRLKG